MTSFGNVFEASIFGALSKNLADKVDPLSA